MLPALKSTRKALAIDAARINVERLPRGLRVLVTDLGEALAYKLVHLRPGNYIDVPKKLHPEHPLHDALGAHDYALLIARRGGERIEVPKDDAMLLQVRHARVRELREQGLSHNAIARRTHYSRRQVINILNDGSEDRAFMQPDLFAALAAPAAAVAHKSRPPKAKAPKRNTLEAQHVWSAHDPFGIARRNAAQTKATRSE